MNRLLSELRRRKVGRVILAYATVVFVVLQVADLALEPLGAPGWVMGVLVLLAGLGLPVASVLAWAYDITPHGIQATADAAPDTADDVIDGSSPRRLAGGRTAVAAGLVLLFTGAAGYVWTRGGGDAVLDEDVVAVMPFRITGDSAAAYLREGMVDLLAATLNGEIGPRAADPRAVLSEWDRAGSRSADLPEDSAALVARKVGAGRMLLGTIVAPSAEELRITARLRHVGRSAPPLEASVTGRPDELHTLLDDLTSQLLSLDAGIARNRLAGVTSTSLPALRSYLLGQSLYRNSRFEDAARSFDAAVDADSTFALAVLGLRLSLGWSAGDLNTNKFGRVRRLIWNSLDRLSGSDAVIARAAVGRYPELRTVRQEIADWEQAIVQAPDRPETWFMFADAMLHRGSLAGHADHLEVSTQGFQRALALDSSFTPAVTHLLDGAIISHDTAAFHRYSALVATRSRDVASYQYFIRTLFGTPGARAQFQAVIDTLPAEDVAPVVWFYHFSGIVDAAQARAAAAALRQRALTTQEKTTALTWSYDLLINMGRPAEARMVGEQLLRVSPDTVDALARIVNAALHAGGDTVGVRQAARRLVQIGAAGSRDPRQRTHAACVAGQWQAWQGEDFAPMLAVLAAHEGASTVAGAEAAVCKRLIGGVHALRTGTNLRETLEQLEALCRDGPPVGNYVTLSIANRVSARLHEAVGDHAGALTAIRREVVLPAGATLVSSRRREAGRLAELAGDREGAIRAYSEYLRLHQQAEPARAAEVEQVRNALARLTADERS